MKAPAPTGAGASLMPRRLQVVGGPHPATPAHRHTLARSLTSGVEWCTHVCTQKLREYELGRNNRPFIPYSADCQTPAAYWENSYPSTFLAMTTRWI